MVIKFELIKFNRSLRGKTNLAVVENDILEKFNSDILYYNEINEKNLLKIKNY